MGLVLVVIEMEMQSIRNNLMKELLPYDDLTSLAPYALTSQLAAVPLPVHLLMAAQNSYSMLGLEDSTPVSELCASGPTLSLPPTNDWKLKLDWGNGFCDICDGNNNVITTANPYPYGSVAPIRGFDPVKWMSKNDPLDWDNMPWCEPDIGCYLDDFGQTKNSILFQELLRQITIAHGVIGQQIVSGEMFVALASSIPIALNEPPIWYGNWCAIHIPFDEQSWLIECYNERIYMSDWIDWNAVKYIITPE